MKAGFNYRLAARGLVFKQDFPEYFFLNKSKKKYHCPLFF